VLIKAEIVVHLAAKAEDFFSSPELPRGLLGQPSTLFIGKLGVFHELNRARV
jgi:hypothetical protein